MSSEDRADMTRTWQIRDNLELVLHTWVAVMKKKQELCLKAEKINSLLKDCQNPALSGAGGDSEEYMKVRAFIDDVTLRKKYMQDLADTAKELQLLRQKLIDLIRTTNDDIDVLFAEKPVGRGRNDENSYTDGQPSTSDTCVGEFHDVQDAESQKKSGLKSMMISIMRSLSRSKEKVNDDYLPYYVDKVPSLDSLLADPENSLDAIQRDLMTGDNVIDLQGDLIKLQ